MIMIYGDYNAQVLYTSPVHDLVKNSVQKSQSWNSWRVWKFTSGPVGNEDVRSFLQIFQIPVR